MKNKNAQKLGKLSARRRFAQKSKEEVSREMKNLAKKRWTTPRN